MIARADASALLTESAYQFEDLTNSDRRVTDHFPEVQVALTAARTSAESAISMARAMNTLRKTAEGKRLQGKYTAEAQDCLRSALLFAGAGLDTALKRLVSQSLPMLVAADIGAAERLSKHAERRVRFGDGGVDPKELIQLLLSTGKTPRDILLGSWIYELTDGSAQSADRVVELASACGMDVKDLRKRIGPTDGKTRLLERAFLARNAIAHELDVTSPAEGGRKKLESIRAYRSRTDIQEWCGEVLDVGQVVVNDVVRRAVL